MKNILPMHTLAMLCTYLNTMLFLKKSGKSGRGFDFTGLGCRIRGCGCREFYKQLLQVILPVCILLGTAPFLSAEESGESFGFDTEENNDFSVNIGGTVSAGGTFFFDEAKNFGSIRPTSIVDGKFHLEAAAPLTEAYFGVRLNDRTLPFALGKQAKEFPATPQIPRWIDAAFLKIMLGPTVFSGGIQKITWGRADALSVLDIVNPKDLTDLSVLNPQRRKIARPMLNFTAYLPFEIKLDTVFLPVFEGNRFALTGRWVHRRHTQLTDAAGQSAVRLENPDTATLAYAQGGGRLTATFGGLHDAGVQYFYGRLHEAAVTVDSTAGSGGTAHLRYNPYHHIGLDYGTSIGPVGIQLEAAAAVTGDVSGTDPAVYNPSLAWNAGLEYALSSIRLNAVAAEKITLQHKKIGTNSEDIEHGDKPTNTTLMFSIAQSLLRGSLEWKIAASVCVEDADFFINPSLHWQVGTLLIDCNLGVFGGSPSGKVGRFAKNNFIQLSLGYEF